MLSWIYLSYVVILLPIYTSNFLPRQLGPGETAQKIYVNTWKGIFRVFWRLKHLTQTKKLLGAVIQIQFWKKILSQNI